jgi:DNA polymerase III gamma/tau subunit
MKDQSKLDNINAYEIIKKIKKLDKFSHAYIIQSTDKEEIKNFSNFLIKNILCDHIQKDDHTEENCSICSKINNKTYLEVEYIEPEGLTIKIDQIRNMQQKLSKKAFAGDKKIYVITNAERLGDKSSNAMLKLIEEPESNIFCILLTDNLYSIITTIRSRCQKLILKSEEKTSSSSIYSELAEEIINNIEKKKINAIQDIHTQFEKKEKEEIILIFDEMINIYKNRLNNSNDKINIIKIKKIIEYKKQIYNNVNLALLFDKIVIEIGGNKND